MSETEWGARQVAVVREGLAQANPQFSARELDAAVLAVRRQHQDADLEPRAVRYEIAGHSVPVASLDDIIRSKEAADRDKDRAVLPVLRLHSRMVKEGRSRKDGDPVS